MGRATSTVQDSSTGTVTEKAKPEFNKLTPLTLGEIDLAALDADQLREYATAAQSRLNDLRSSTFVDKRTGVVYLNGKQVGNVNRPANTKTVNPFRAKEDDIVNGQIVLDSKVINNGWDKANKNLVDAMRINLAPYEGNGVNLVGQSGKSLEAAATALATIKGGLS